jgi:hypothetical protein
MPTRKNHSKPRKSSQEEKYKQSHLSSWVTRGMQQTRTRYNKNNSTSLEDAPSTITQREPNREALNRDTNLGHGLTKTNYTQTRLVTDTTNNLPFGNLLSDNSTSSERIVFHNINGMKDQTNWYQIINAMRENDVNIFGFVELNQALTRGYNNAWISTI